ncbi:MAG: putative 2OG-Fe(II) oxygenase [Pseudomonadota bacterium]
MSQEDLYRSGVQAFNAGAFERAYEALRTLSHPQAAHLAAISAQKTGRMSDAADLFLKASKLAPADPNIANNFGHFLFSTGQLEAAAKQFSIALESAPNLAPALIGLAKIEAQHKNWDASGKLYERVLEASPTSMVGQYGLATALLETGKANQAAPRFERVIAKNRSPEAIFMLGRTRLDQGKQEEALSCFRDSYALAPSEHAFRNLANLLWMQGDTSAFDDLVDAAPAELQSLAVTLLTESGQLERAQRKWESLYSARPQDVSAWLLKANIARAQQDAEGLAGAADGALALDPQSPSALDARIVADLMLGRPKQALERVQPLRRAAPHSQHWIAHEFTAHRLMGTENAMLDLDQFIGVYDIAAPPGYASIEAFNAELETALKTLHSFQARPLNQSLRGTGTQTTLSLSDVDHAVINTYVQALHAPIQDYLSRIGRDPAHPTAARNRDTYTIKGIWSILLRGGGFHEPHVHPDGWISSAYYVTVPAETKSAADRAGWIGFGTPPYKLPEGAPETKWICPQPGRLVLFPSFLWHGTRPIADQAERLTAPFDLIP